MAEGESKMEKSDVTAHVIPNVTSSKSPTRPKSSPTTQASRAGRWKLSRSASKGWFNKSLDQSSLSTSISPHPKPIRRQSSVSDFFQSMLTKSRSHLIGLFSGNAKKENTRHSMLDISNQLGAALDTSTSTNSSNLGLSSDNHAPNTSNHRLCSSLSSENIPFSNERTSSRSSISGVSDNFNVKDKQATKGRTSPGDMFIVTSNNDVQMKANLGKTSSPLRHSSQSLNSQKDETHRPKLDRKYDFFLGPRSTTESNNQNQPHLQHSTSITFSILDFTEQESGKSDDESEKHGPDKYRHISNAQNSRSFFLTSSDNKTKPNAKRALAKSNSDTITKFSAGLTPISKASSDGNCFKASQTQSSMSASVAAKITDYLYVGSVEAAYNEPLLCKYKITSLIDMTNINPRLVPLHKKSDCPCPCVNTDHFRSKFNIGVDDIEWENLEQYFKEINTFIDGSRKKKGRTLIFSYMGQSRAPAAAIQHLMHHYGMSYREAFTIMVSKWPQTKLNPGFIKTLKRLEVNLFQEKEKMGLSPKASMSILQSRDVCAVDGGIDEAKNERVSDSLPPVVRGAWLEC